MKEAKFLVRGSLTADTYKRLSHLAVDRGVTRPVIVEEAVEAYLKAIEALEAQKGGA